MKKIAEKVILAKKEVTYGVDITPLGANAILTKDFSVKPLNGQSQQRNNDRPNLGGEQRYRTGDHVQCQFKVELAGSGVAGTAPGWNELMLACGFAETIVAVTSVAYDPTSADGDSATIVYNADGIEHRILGARGAVGLDLSAGGLPYLNFSFAGLYVLPTDTAAAVPDFSAFQKPQTVEKANTPTFTLDGFAAVLVGLNVSQGQKVEYKNRPNLEGVFITDRDYTGQAKIHAPTIAEKNFFALAEAETLFAMQMIHGTTAGNIVQIDAAQTQVLNPDYDGDGDVLGLNLGLALNASDAGDDDIKITLT